MKLGHEIHYEKVDWKEAIEEALIKEWGQTIEKNKPILGSRLRDIMQGRNFVEKNELANHLLQRGLVLKGKGEIAAGDKFIKIANTVRPILPGGIGGYRCSGG